MLGLSDLSDAGRHASDPSHTHLNAQKKLGRVGRWGRAGGESLHLNKKSQLQFWLESKH